MFQQFSEAGGGCPTKAAREAGCPHVKVNKHHTQNIPPDESGSKCEVKHSKTLGESSVRVPDSWMISWL